VAFAADDVWQIYPLLETHDTLIDADWLGFILAVGVADRLHAVPPEVVGECLTRVFSTGRHDLIEAVWRQVFLDAPGFVPDFWLYQSLCRTLAEGGVADPAQQVSDLLGLTQAGRLAPLFAVYAQFLRQADVALAMDKAAALDDPEHRRKIAVWALGASQTNALMPLAVRLHEQVSGPDDTHDRQFMQARLATAEGRWADVLRLTAPLVETGELRHAALCLRALALAHDGKHDEARTALDHIRRGGHAPWFLVGRANLIDLTNRLLQEARPLPGSLPAPALATGPGRPLAQSLWIGPRLRWIERLSMQSYLANGWRYQLLVYDVPDNVPEGVELMDAAAILPRDALFREGAGSGMHRGSVGAFSDLFRYALLAQRGGMWTDTDVINLDRFEPDGQRFVATEINDAGILGTNGAMMAAPAGCQTQRDALRRARTLLDEGGVQFARIGPVLLAEIFAADGLHGYDLLPPDFLNPLGWMETGALLEPFCAFTARPALATARNIHVYTETWRLIGLSLDRPPSDDSFLARLSMMLEDPPKSLSGVRELLR
jgi:Glycosyltransferase sugar-binding region containing DXD motif